METKKFAEVLREQLETENHRVEVLEHDLRQITPPTSLMPTNRQVELEALLAETGEKLELQRDVVTSVKAAITAYERAAGLLD